MGHVVLSTRLSRMSEAVGRDYDCRQYPAIVEDEV
jgi:hypothetical protein